MHRLSKLAPAVLLTLVAGVVLPSHAAATVAVTVGSFGMFHTTATMSPNFVTQPVGAVDCDTPIPFTFTGIPVTSTTIPTMRYLQVWTAAANSASCQTHTSRTSTGTPPCTLVSTGVDLSYMTGGTSYTFSIKPRQLFGGCGTGQASFWFFDTTSTTADLSTDFATGGYYEIDIALDASPPPMPALGGDVAGDNTITINWTATDVGIAGGVNAYFDPNGCSGEAGSGSSVLIAGQQPSASAQRVFTQTMATTTTASIAATNFGWSSSLHGQTGALAITVTDSAGNVSVLSNVVCVQHVLVTGFWEQYCAEHGMPDIAQCTANYHSCAVGTPSPHTDFSAVLFGVGVLGVLGARRSRRRAR